MGEWDVPSDKKKAWVVAFSDLCDMEMMTALRKEEDKQAKVEEAEG